MGQEKDKEKEENEEDEVTFKEETKKGESDVADAQVLARTVVATRVDEMRACVQDMTLPSMAAIAKALSGQLQKMAAPLVQTFTNLLLTPLQFIATVSA